ncbi:hypothetical protein PHYPSEUDO_015417 [Phytophthora pseudosyringae]|uniref:Uncharacterized protein n=1 Tax=Phytophthora pseudosyringae TaxID=221518 RepID=A0A8T1W3E2_9STRA|nr:hypothetical protein PHYPSEUDO_015417 [Phytophthora pseudosyringae]
MFQALSCLLHSFLHIARRRSETRKADPSPQADMVSPIGTALGRESIPAQPKESLVKTRRQQFDAAREMQREDVDVTDAGHCVGPSPAASTTYSNISRLTEWLEAFEEQHLMRLEDEDVVVCDDHATTEVAPQTSRLAVWLTRFETKRQEKPATASTSA